MDLRIDGKNAIVCGSTSGIGKAIVKEFAESGANVILIARNEEKLKEVLGELKNNDKKKECDPTK